MVCFHTCIFSLSVFKASWSSFSSLSWCSTRCLWRRASSSDASHRATAISFSRRTNLHTHFKLNPNDFKLRQLSVAPIAQWLYNTTAMKSHLYLSISSICSVVFPSSLNDRSRCSCWCCCCTWRLLEAISSICWCRSAFCFPSSSQRRFLLDRSSWRRVKLLRLNRNNNNLKQCFRRWSFKNLLKTNWLHFTCISFSGSPFLDISWKSIQSVWKGLLPHFFPLKLDVLPSAVSPVNSRLQSSPAGWRRSCLFAPLTPSSLMLLSGIFSWAPEGPPHQQHEALARAHT